MFRGLCTVTIIAYRFMQIKVRPRASTNASDESPPCGSHAGDGLHVATERMVEADAREPGIDARVDLIEARLRERDLRIDEGGTGRTSVHEQLACNAIPFGRAL